MSDNPDHPLGLELAQTSAFPVSPTTERERGPKGNGSTERAMAPGLMEWMGRSFGDAVQRAKYPLERMLQALPAAIYTTDAVGRITFYNEAAAKLWGCRPEIGKSEFCGSWKLYWPDGRPMAHEECPMALALREQRDIRGMEAIAERPDGSRVPFMSFPTPVYDASGTVVGAVNMLVDITDRNQALERQRLIVAEMKHRMRNLLATVQAIAMQTLPSASDNEREAFIARLQALAKAQDLLTPELWHKATLNAVVTKALAPFQRKHGDRILIRGPDGVWLGANKSLTLAMALHELATNAIKHGALSNGTGQVRIEWDYEVEAGKAKFLWRESGGPPVEPPAHRGFGSRLIGSALKGELETVRMDFHPDGLICMLEIAVGDGLSHIDK